MRGKSFITKKFWFFICILIYSQNIICQEKDTILNFLEGKWEWYKTYRGGFAGGYIYPSDSGYTLTMEFNGLQKDSVNFTLYKNGYYTWDTITTIFPIDMEISLWAIDKNIIPTLDRFLYIFRPVQELEYLQLWVVNRNYIEFCEPLAPESPCHDFKRSISNDIPQLDNKTKVVISPNPFNEFLYLEQLPQEILSVKLFDILGHNVYQVTIKNKESYCIRPVGLSKGIYFIRIINSSKKELLLFQQIIKI